MTSGGLLRQLWGEIKDGFRKGLESVDGSGDSAERGAWVKTAPRAKRGAHVKGAPARLTSPNAIADTILAFDPISLSRPARPMTHAEYATSQGLASPRVRTEAEHANAFLFGVIADRMIKAEKAWKLSYELSRRFGHLDVAKLARMFVADLREKLEKPTKLHRFNEAIAKGIIAASQRIVTAWNGSATNMWARGVSAPELLAELESLPGISHKLSSMTLQILITRLGVEVRDVDAVNIAVDRHVARVFLRTGLVTGDKGRTVFRAGELKPLVIAAARHASPVFPGALDFGAFWSGKNWCTHTAPRCGECPIRSACPRKRTAWSIGTMRDGKLVAE